MKRHLSAVCLLVLYFATIYISGKVHQYSVGVDTNRVVHNVCCSTDNSGQDCQCPPCLEQGYCSCSCESDQEDENIEQLKKHASFEYYSQPTGYSFVNIVLLGNIFAQKRIIKFSRYHNVTIVSQLFSSIFLTFENDQTDFQIVPACKPLILHTTDTSPPIA
jgi:hypothetical protein